MNILDNNPFSEQPKTSNEIMAMAMGEIHDILIQPMQDELTPEQNSVISIIGLALKVMAEKATALEQMEQDELNNPKQDDFYRN